ncbi:MAG: CpsB/CapC family capsule biosynthesis tyrosine phosphatase [Syntrophomonadaceae bacterium]
MDLIDIHTHILPGADDGAQDLKEALAMAEAAVKDGVNLLVATPRVCPGMFDNTRAEILNKVQILNQCLELSHIKLPILAGAEYVLTPDLPQHYSVGKLLTINDTGRYLLVELPHGEVPTYTEQVFYGLLQQGVIPIITAPENNRVLARDPEILQELCTRGILAQVNSASLTGRSGRSAKKAAWTFLENGTAQLIGSDSNPSAGRMPVLYAAFQEVERRMGASMARTFISHNPFHVIKGQELERVQRTAVKKSWKQYLPNFD